MKRFMLLLVISSISVIVCDEPELKISVLNHPDKNGYQSINSAKSEKHKFGYELKDNKHFHHTITEKDGVRLGCYGYELDGKKYSTQYVADSRGYRIVSNQDIITVYPKSGGTIHFNRKASVGQDSNESSAAGSSRYYFPEGCKGIDVLIDNSSRLRRHSLNVRLPVTKKTTPIESYVYNTPPNSYIPPGPLNIYAPNQIIAPTQKDPTPDKCNHSEESTDEPSNAYLPPGPSNAYLPPAKTEAPDENIDATSTHLPPNAYLPPDTSEENINNAYLPPGSPEELITNEILPPYFPNKCEETCCDDHSVGKLVIPIPMSAQEKDGSRVLYGKLILPIKGFDEDGVKKLTKSLFKKADTSQLLKNILESLL